MVLGMHSEYQLVNVRHAIRPALRGFHYQILQSVLAWVQLSKDEILFLEGAEDFDQLSEGGAIVTQVKNTSGSGTVTLRTLGLLQAINNCWSHQKNNPAYRIRFRYLTTSAVGIEQGNPFGPGVSGIEIWRKAKSPANDIQPGDLNGLKDFLLTLSGLSEPVKEFLRTCTATDFLNKLIEPIDWDTDAYSTEDVMGEIRERLMRFGNTRGISPEDADKAIAALHFRAWKVATGKPAGERKLYRADFEQIFMDSAGVWIANSKIPAALRAAQNKVRPDIRHFLLDPSPDKLPLPLQSHATIIDRDLEIELLKSYCQMDRVVPIIGLPSSGKSTIIRKLIASLLQIPKFEINGKPFCLLYVNLAGRRPYCAVNDSLRLSRDIVAIGGSEIYSTDDDDDIAEQMISKAGDLIDYILSSCLHNKSMVAVLEKYSEMAENTAEELKTILDAEPFRHSVTFIELDWGQVPSSARSLMPALEVEPLSVEHAVKLLVARQQNEGTARRAINFLGQDSTILYPGILVKGADRYPALLKKSDGEIPPEKLAEAFLEESYRVVESVLLDLGCDEANAVGAAPLQTLLVMALFAEAKVSKSVIEAAGLAYPPIGKLRQLGWIVGEEHFSLTGLAREGLRAKARAALGDETERATVVGAARRLFEACKTSPDVENFPAALEEMMRWLAKNAPKEKELAALFFQESSQLSVLDLVPPLLPEEEAEIVPQLEEDIGRGNLDAALAHLILAMRTNSQDRFGERTAAEEYVIRAKKTVELVGKIPYLSASQLKSLDTALHVGSRRHHRFKEVLACRVSVHERLSRLVPSSEESTSWTRVWTHNLIQ